MARLIDADRAIEIVRSQGVAHPNAYHLTNYATLILQEAPTVDAVPVVHCKDCRKFKTYGCRMVASGYDDFCSYGERKDGDSYWQFKEFMSVGFSYSF